MVGIVAINWLTRAESDDLIERFTHFDLDAAREDPLFDAGCKNSLIHTMRAK